MRGAARRALEVLDLDGPHADLWGVLVDLVCLGFVTWVVTGIYMWWKLRALRRWGTVALAAGLVSFFGLVSWW